MPNEFTEVCIGVFCRVPKEFLTAVITVYYSLHAAARIQPCVSSCAMRDRGTYLKYSIVKTLQFQRFIYYSKRQEFPIKLTSRLRSLQ